MQVQRGKIVLCAQPYDLGLLSLRDDLTMGAYQAADRAVGQDVLVVGLPAEEAGDRDERQLLREQTGPFLEAAGNVIMMPLCGGKTTFPGMAWVCVGGWAQIWRERVRVPKRLAPVTGSWPSACTG